MTCIQKKKTSIIIFFFFRRLRSKIIFVVLRKKKPNSKQSCDVAIPPPGRFFCLFVLIFVTEVEGKKKKKTEAEFRKCIFFFFRPGNEPKKTKFKKMNPPTSSSESAVAVIADLRLSLEEASAEIDSLRSDKSGLQQQLASLRNELAKKVEDERKLQTNIQELLLRLSKEESKTSAGIPHQKHAISLDDDDDDDDAFRELVSAERVRAKQQHRQQQHLHDDVNDDLDHDLDSLDIAVMKLDQKEKDKKQKETVNNQDENPEPGTNEDKADVEQQTCLSNNNRIHNNNNNSDIIPTKPPPSIPAFREKQNLQTVNTKHKRGHDHLYHDDHDHEPRHRAYDNDGSDKEKVETAEDLSNPNRQVNELLGSEHESEFDDQQPTYITVTSAADDGDERAIKGEGIFKVELLSTPQLLASNFSGAQQSLLRPPPPPPPPLRQLQQQTQQTQHHHHLLNATHTYSNNFYYSQSMSSDLTSVASMSSRPNSLSGYSVQQQLEHESLTPSASNNNQQQPISPQHSLPRTSNVFVPATISPTLTANTGNVVNYNNSNRILPPQALQQIASTSGGSCETSANAERNLIAWMMTSQQQQQQQQQRHAATNYCASAVEYSPSVQSAVMSTDVSVATSPLAGAKQRNPSLGAGQPRCEGHANAENQSEDESAAEAAAVNKSKRGEGQESTAIQNVNSGEAPSGEKKDKKSKEHAGLPPIQYPDASTRSAKTQTFVVKTANVAITASFSDILRAMKTSQRFSENDDDDEKERFLEQQQRQQRHRNQQQPSTRSNSLQAQEQQQHERASSCSLSNSVTTAGDADTIAFYDNGCSLGAPEETDSRKGLQGEGATLVMGGSQTDHQEVDERVFPLATAQLAQEHLDRLQDLLDHVNSVIVKSASLSSRSVSAVKKTNLVNNIIGNNHHDNDN